MNSLATAEALLGRIPGWEDRPRQIVPMPGGFSHRCFRIESAGYRYVLRVPRPDHAPNPERFALECRVQQQAAGRGLAPPVIYSDAATGLMLAEWIPGRAWTQQDLQHRPNLQELAGLLSQLHRLPRCGTAFDPRAAADGFLSALDKDLAGSKIASTCKRVIEAAPAPAAWCLCHNDVVAENLIRGRALKFVDFEFACDNEPLFDLASVIGWHNLPDSDSEWLLAAYADGATPALREQLRMQLRLFDALQWLWLAVQQQRRPGSDARGQLERVATRLR